MLDNPTDATVLQVKVRRNDVYDAVRNILINEFKIIPADLMAAVDKKIEARIGGVAEQLLNRYGFDNKVQKAMEAGMDRIKTRIDTVIYDLTKQCKEMMKEEVVNQVRSAIAPELTTIVRNIIEGKG